MKTKMVLVAALAIVGGLFTSCNSDDSDNCIADFTGELAETEKVLEGSWTLTAITADKEVDLTDDDEDNPSTNIYAQSTNCQKDAVYSFSADRKFSFKQAANTSSCDNKSNILGTWKLAGEKLNLIYFCSQQTSEIDFNDDKSTFSFSSNQSVKEIDGDIIQAKITFTYTKAVAGTN